ncbi:hypothetical protein [Campylobacter coli]|uniref:hypothetical protein n=1 Tax=Campylobacter coli TaxID=195 RepID=UPI0037F40233
MQRFFLYRFVYTCLKAFFKYKNAFKHNHNSALIRFLIFPPVGKKLLVVGKLFLEKIMFPNKLGKNCFFCLNMFHFLGKNDIIL